MDLSAAGAGFCAIDFGTSNSAVAVAGAADVEVELVALEDGAPTMPTAVFYFADGPEAHDGPPRAFGRAAIAAYVDGLDGRLMRSMKSILGSALAEQTTDAGGGRGVRYLDVIAGYLLHLRRRAEQHTGGPIERAVLGRPVFFVDGDPQRDARAQSSLEQAAHRIGLREVSFQFEPIAAALAHEQTLVQEEIVLVADIGGGTSDFSVVRVGPGRSQRADRRDDVLASHGVHVAGTDFDRRIELAAILPLFGYRARGPAAGDAAPREVPSAVYFDLATWHLINTVYTPQRAAELRAMRSYYADPRQHARLMTVVEERLGHELAARAESAKIEIAAGGATRIDLGLIERALAAELSAAHAIGAIEADIQAIVAAALETVHQAGLAAQRVSTLFFTGGSTGLLPLAERIAAAFPLARPVRGDRFASVATGLGLHALRRYGRAR